MQKKSLTERRRKKIKRPNARLRWLSMAAVASTASALSALTRTHACRTFKNKYENKNKKKIYCEKIRDNTRVETNEKWMENNSGCRCRCCCCRCCCKPPATTPCRASRKCRRMEMRRAKQNEKEKKTMKKWRRKDDANTTMNRNWQMEFVIWDVKRCYIPCNGGVHKFTISYVASGCYWKWNRRALPQIIIGNKCSMLVSLRWWSTSCIWTRGRERERKRAAADFQLTCGDDAGKMCEFEPKTFAFDGNGVRNRCRF